MSVVGVLITGLALIASTPILAQSSALPGCARIAEDAPQTDRLLAPGCSTATFEIPAVGALADPLRIRATQSSVFVRAMQLTYGDGRNAHQQVVSLAIQDILQSDQPSPPIALNRSGLRLRLIKVDVEPVASADGPIRLSLADPASVSPVRASAAALASPVRLDPAEWSAAGSTAVHTDRAQDIITIGREKGRFDRLVITTRNSAVPLRSIQVFPVDAPPIRVDVQGALVPGAGAVTIPIDPPAFIRTVDLNYEIAQAVRGGAVAEVAGHYDQHWLGRIGENRQFAGGWIMLGTVDVVAKPHGQAPPGLYHISGRENERFSKLRFVARRGAVDLASATLETGNGQQESIPIEAMLMPDIPSKPALIHGGPIPIESVAVVPRIGAHSRIDATIEVWAQY